MPPDRPARLTVAVREKAVEAFLKERSAAGHPPVPAREIFDAVSVALGDTVTREAYYKLLYRMEADGKLVRHVLPGGRNNLGFTLSTYLIYDVPITRADVQAMLAREDSPAEVLARIADGEELYRAHRKDVLRKAARDLLEINPAELYADMLLHKLRKFERDYLVYRHLGPDQRDASFVAELHKQADQLNALLFQLLSFPAGVVRFEPNALDSNRPSATLYKLRPESERTITAPTDSDSHEVTDENIDDALLGYRPSEEEIRKVVRARVIGSTFIQLVQLDPHILADIDPVRTRVAGTDASMHVGGLNLIPGAAYSSDTDSIVEFNNSAGVVQGFTPTQERDRDRTHSAPFTRTELDNPRARGLVMSRALFPDLPDATYIHAVKTANDVVQMRVDRDLIRGEAYDLEGREPIPRPYVLLRDGAVAPQSRDFQHYNRYGDFYGEIAAEGIQIQASILKHLVGTAMPTRRQIYGGAVKGAQTRVFCLAINWWIAHGSRKIHGEPLDPSWEERAEYVRENAAVTMLLSALPDVVKNLKEGRYYVTCALVRQFASLTDAFYKLDRKGATWEVYFEGRREAYLKRYEEGEVTRMVYNDVADDPYVYLCGHADYVSFFVGHTAGDPAPLLPRYEFLTSLREYTDLPTGGIHPQLDLKLSQVEDVVNDHLTRILAMLHHFRVLPDNDHDFMTDKSITRLQPASIYKAHERAKTIGKKLEAEVAAAITRKLIELRRGRAGTAAATFKPVTLRQFVAELGLSSRLSTPTSKDEINSDVPEPDWLEGLDDDL